MSGSGFREANWAVFQMQGSAPGRAFHLHGIRLSGPQLGVGGS